MIAPSSIHWEIGNAISTMFKRNRIGISEARQAISIYEQIPIKFIDVSLVESVEMANQESMYAYDAYLLICSRKRNSPLLSLDQKLIEIAKKNNIQVLEA